MPLTAPKSSLPQHLTIPLPLMLLIANVFRKSSVFYYIMRVLSIPPCWLPLALLPPNKQTVLKQPCRPSCIYSMHYCASHPDAVIWFHASDIVLWMHNDASYLTAPKGCLHAASYTFLSSQPFSLPTATDPAPLTMAPFMFFAKSCIKLSPVPLKLN